MAVSGWILDIAIVLFLLWIGLYFYFTRKFNYWKKKNIPYAPPIPFFGNALEVFTFQQNIGQMTQKIYDSTLKPFVGFFIIDEPYLLIRDPELVKEVLVKDFAIFNDRTIFENKKDDPMGSHLLFMLKNPDWRKMRRKISPVFTTAKLKTMYYLIQKAGIDMAQYIENEINKNPVIDIREITAKYTTEAITSTAFGLEANCFTNANSPFREVSRRVFDWSNWGRAISTSSYFIAPNMVKWFKLKFVDSASADFLRDAFWKTMLQREKNKVARNDLLDILIDIKKEEDIDDPCKLEGDILVAQATQFFLAGFETTSSAITFALYELARNMDIQDKLRIEIQDTLKKHGEISYNSLKEMEYLDLCVKETLRKYPILPFLDRRCSVEYKIPGTDITLEKGTAIFVSTLGLHYDERYYPNPEKFDPSRFTEENEKMRPPFTYLPFGEGPRNCIGARFGNASMKSGLAQILSKFEVVLCKETQNPLKIDPKGFLMAPCVSLFLEFRKC